MVNVVDRDVGERIREERASMLCKMVGEVIGPDFSGEVHNVMVTVRDEKGKSVFYFNQVFGATIKVVREDYLPYAEKFAEFYERHFGGEVEITNKY